MDTSRAGEARPVLSGGLLQYLHAKLFLLSENSIFADRFCEEV